MTGVFIGLIVLVAIGMLHYQIEIAPMADKHGHIINNDKKE